MHIKNNGLYRNYELDPISVMLYPSLDVYNDTDAVLTPEQEQKLDSEIGLLDKFMSLSSVRDILKISDGDIVTISQYFELLPKVKADLKKHDIPEEILDYVFSIDEGDGICAYMMPNRIFPITSICSLKNSKNSCVYSGESINQRRWNLVGRYDDKVKELKECSDEKFVEKQLAPLKKEIEDFDNNEKNQEILKAIKKNEDTFNTYLVNIGLKEEFDAYEGITVEATKTVVKKTKKKP